MSGSEPQTLYTKTGKRAFDFAAASGGLILLSPIFLVLALLVKLTSPGPMLYRQARVGRNGKIFRIAKFRSMHVDADKRGLAITSSGDPRVTPVGRVLRQFKLDELPQLWNVLKGEMSLVGPRPEVPTYVECYSASQRDVLSVRPGITDPASILFRDEEKVLAIQTDRDRYYREIVLPEKLRLNLKYLTDISFSHDFSLLWRTLSCVLFPTNTHVPAADRHQQSEKASSS